MFSVFAEPFAFRNITPYAGAGIGSTWMKAAANDTAVAGECSETKFTWQADVKRYDGCPEILGNFRDGLYLIFETG